MKQFIKLLSIAVLGAMMLASCGEKKDPIPHKPVVTADMFSVLADAESGVVVFKFMPTDLSPFWTVTDPNNQKITFTDREATKTFEVKGLYSGTVVAFNAAGQSDPVDFNFIIGDSSWNPTLSYTENVLMSTTWKPYYLGWYGGEGEGYWEWEEMVPEYLQDDRVVFAEGGKLEWKQGDTKLVYNDNVTGGKEEFTFSGNEKWSYVKDGDKEYMQFSDGGFPGIKGGESSVNGKYEIKNVTVTSVTLLFCIGGDDPNYHIYVTLVPEEWEAPDPSINTDVTEAAANAALSGKKFHVTDYGWWGEGWQYFAIADGGADGDFVPPFTANDFITFKADGSLVITLVEDDPIEEGGSTAPRIYNDGVANGEPYVVSGSPKWQVVSDASVTKVQFSEGGFPLMLAGKVTTPDDPDYHFGLNAKWTVNSIDVDGTVRLDIFQTFTGEQWFTVFLTPVLE